MIILDSTIFNSFLPNLCNAKMDIWGLYDSFMFESFIILG